MDSMGEVVSAISGVMGMGQAQMIHRQGLEVTHQLHREAIAQAERFHQQSMDFDLLSAMRENSRDIWAQKNNTTNTLMFSCGFAIIVEGMPPEGSPPWVLRGFAFSVSSAICMLFLSTWMAMKLMVRMSKYNIFDVHGVYDCNQQHPTFKGYYHCHCRYITRWGYRLFYLGTLLLVVTAALLLWQRFSTQYNDRGAGVVFVAVVATCGGALVVLQLMLPASTRRSTLVNSRSIQDELTRVMGAGEQGGDARAGAVPPSRLGAKGAGEARGGARTQRSRYDGDAGRPSDFGKGSSSKSKLSYNGTGGAGTRTYSVV